MNRKLIFKNSRFVLLCPNLAHLDTKYDNLDVGCRMTGSTGDEVDGDIGGGGDSSKLIYLSILGQAHYHNCRTGTRSQPSD